MDVGELELTGIIAFDGLTKYALQLHPDQQHFVYPMGNKVTIKHIETGAQQFLSGHTNLISAMCISPCGKFIASGQINHQGFKTMVIVWNYHEKTIKASHRIHKVRVEDIAFSCDSNFLITLGGRDDGNVVIWDVHKNEALCGAFASTEIAGNAYTVRRMNKRDLCFMTGGDRTLKVWRVNRETRKVYGVDVQVGKLRRCINCVVIDDRDELAYCGTTSGDIIKARLNYSHNWEIMEPLQTPVMIDCYSKISKDPKNRKLGIGDLYSGGVTNLILLYSKSQIIVGTGDGTIELTTIVDLKVKQSKKIKLPSTPQIKTLLSENVRSQVTSMVIMKNEYLIVATAFSEIYQVKLSDFDMRLLVTCHTSTIYEIVFPHDYSEIFATASKNDIRLWRLDTQKELLRITVPNIVCTSLFFSYNGGMLVSAWNDGIIRAFTPQSGRLIFSILNAHLKAVSAVVATKDGKKIISGGCDGQVRIWEIEPDVQKLIIILKEHRGSVTTLNINRDSTEVISSSTDGTCVVWDIERCARKQVLMGNTMYMCACFSPNAVQILTCGTDRKITYWETLDGSIVREIEGSETGALNTLDVSPDGQYFVTGGNDSIVKVWSYMTGESTHTGMGHAAIITSCKISPDGKHIVTVSGDGAIMIWKSPFEMKSARSISKSSRASINSSRSTCSVREEKLKKHLKLDLGDENVSDFTPRSDTIESVKIEHEGGDEASLCKCDPTQPTPCSAKCSEDNDKSPIIKTARSSNSIARSCKSNENSIKSSP